MGGAMNQDLQLASYTALGVPRHEARARALDFSWAHATQLFAHYLVPARVQGARNDETCEPATVAPSVSSIQ